MKAKKQVLTKRQEQYVIDQLDVQGVGYDLSTEAHLHCEQGGNLLEFLHGYAAAVQKAISICTSIPSTLPE